MKKPRPVSGANGDESSQSRGNSRVGVAELLYGLIERVAGTPLAIRVEAWDDSTAGPADAALTLSVRSARAISRLLWAPGELGAARAYVAGDLDLSANSAAILGAFSDPSIASAVANARRSGRARLGLWLDLLALAVDTGQLRLSPPVPSEEAHVRGRLHSRRRDAAAISHHYDLGNDFYRLLLGDSMVYSCAYWTADPGETYALEEAQRDKLEVVCGKLALQPGQRLLDVGCGWGSHPCGRSLPRPRGRRHRIGGAGHFCEAGRRSGGSRWFGRDPCPGLPRRR